ncbi:monalysin family beta-barrel pore-forming toxin [Pseudomonas putida]|uniref:monalysin family beta-barrel pore-forming toxin n=1 Tax=Pseudomonas putida TaxID=303 RepID=UPI0034D4C28D
MPEYELLSPDDFPSLSGSYLIEKYLVSTDEFNRGCWVDGETVRGGFGFPSGQHEVLTRPVFAYLDYLGTHKTLSIEDSELDLSRASGHEVWFAHEAKGFSAPSEIELVNVISELLSGFPAEGWSPHSSVGHTVRVAGAESYVAYQLKLVYAHWVEDGNAECADLFTVQPAFAEGGSDGVFFLSSVATDLIWIGPGSDEIKAPLSRKMLYHLIFNLAYGAPGGAGWNFNHQAASDRFLQYRMKGHVQ